MERRIVYQLVAVILFAVVYVVGKGSLMAQDFTSVPSFYYPYFIVGSIMLFAAGGFSYIGFTVIEKESTRTPVHKTLFILLQLVSFAIVIEFYTLKAFHYPVMVQLLGIFAVMLLLFISASAKVRDSAA